MNDPIALYLDYAALSVCRDWENVVVDAVDDLIQARKDLFFAGMFKRYYYIGYDKEVGQWMNDG